MVERNKIIENFPVSLFSATMGLSGFAMAINKMANIYKLDITVFLDYFAWGILGLFILMFGMYCAKIAFYREAFFKELRSVIKINFFATVTASLLLIAALFEALYPFIGYYLWIAGTVSQFMLSVYIINIWLHHQKCEIKDVTPAWIIPAVANILVPFAGAKYAYYELSWFFFSAGILFWLIVQSMILFRLFFTERLEAKLLPTMFILIAPPAVGFISYVSITSQVDNFARFLVYAGTFMAVLMLSKSRRFFRQKFYVSWWAFGFPTAAITNANLLMYMKTGVEGTLWIGEFLFSILSALMIFLLVRTVIAIKNNEIFKKE